MIYTIYIWKENSSLFVVFERQINEVKSSYITQFLESGAFAEEALVLGEISFLILLSLVWTLGFFSPLT